MPITQSLNSKGNVKKLSTNDVPNSPQFPVVSRYEATSTAAQTVINLSFSVDQSNTDSFILIVDGKTLRPGAIHDYTFTAVNSLNQSSQITMNYALPINLNIIALKLGVKKEAEFNMDNRFVQLYNAMNAGFQNFVDTSSTSRLATTTTGTPAAANFYSSIIGRAAITDISQDLKPSLGIERIMTQQSFLMQNEVGSSGEPVFGVTNDDRGLIRFVGTGWTNLNDTNGIRVQSSTVNDYAEITFYGTGLNLFTNVSGGTFDLRASTDGGSEGAQIGGTFAALLSSRNVSCGSILPAVSGLTLGVHTVKIRLNSGSYVCFGFEVVNANSVTSLNINPGTGYVQGQKLLSSAATTSAYNSGFTNISGTAGTKGGRVLVYQKPDGTIAKDVQYTNVSQVLGSSADHTNEELARPHYFREFGVGKSYDFSLVSTGASDLAATLDDGTTSLVGTSLGAVTHSTGVQGISTNANGSFLTFTFVGTGVDAMLFDAASGGSDTYNYQIDGGATQTWFNTAGSLSIRTVKFASGLPYGTHTLRINRVTAATWSPCVVKFMVYQPKKPSLPSGCVELADYNIMADYVVNAGAGLSTIATGVLRKFSKRELAYVDGTGGTLNWSNAGIDPGNLICGSDTNTDRTGASYAYTFFGTGVELRGIAATDRKNGDTVTINGLAATTANFPTLTSSNYGGWTFSAGTLNCNASIQQGAGVRINGLPLGIYTIKVTSTNSTSSVYLAIDTIDVITPIHSHRPSINYDLQNTLPIGSCAISDNRKISAVKESYLQKKNVSQAFGVTSGPTSGAVGFIPLPDMSVVHMNTSGMLDISYSVTTISTSGSNNLHQFQVYVDGAPVGTAKQYTCTVSIAQTVSDRFLLPVAPGVHKVEVYWSVGGGTLQATGVLRNLIVREN